jgi:hypothetical protein
VWTVERDHGELDRPFVAQRPSSLIPLLYPIRHCWRQDKDYAARVQAHMDRYKQKKKKGLKT